MDNLKVITNNIPRNVVEAYELTTAERAEFDYLNWPAIEAGSDSATFFRYRGELYDLEQFEYVRGVALRTWDGFKSDSFFSGIVVRYVNNYEQVIVGTYIS